MAGNDEDLSETLCERGLKLVEPCAFGYQPDGMYSEGPAYWHCGNYCHVMRLAACGPFSLRARDAESGCEAGGRG
jgi:hypothetical protein